MRNHLFIFSLILVACGFSIGCNRKEHNPLLGTPDGSVSSVQMHVRGVDNSRPPDLTILFQSVANSTFRMKDLSLGNFAVLQDGVPGIPTSYAPAGTYPFAVMIVIDRSGSMDASFSGVTRTEAANSAAVTFLQNLPASAHAGLVEFHSNVQVTVPMTPNKDAVIAAVSSSTFGSGGTALYDAIVIGAEELSKATGLRLLIVLTDGEDTGSGHTPADAMNALLTIGTVASGVIIGGDVDDTSIMEGILEPTGGTVSTSLDAAQLAADLDATLTSGAFDDIYALTFRRRSSESNIKVYVSYGSNTASVDLSVHR